MGAFVCVTEFGELRVDALSRQLEALGGCLDDFGKEFWC
jgi:hypothetical protein